MPHIKSKTTGRVFHDVDSQTGALFVEAGLYDYFTPVQLGSKVAPPPTVPTFAVVMNSEHNKFEIVLTLPGGGVSRFNGEPRLARNAFKNRVWSAAEQAQTLQGPEPPENILREYAEAFGRPSAETRAFAASVQQASDAAELAKLR